MKGIEMPPKIQKRESTNPFDELFDNQEEEVFEGFQEAKSVGNHEQATSTGSNVLSQTNHFENMLHFDLTKLSNPQLSSANIKLQQESQKPAFVGNLLEMNFEKKKQEEEQTPQTYEDLLYNQLKNAKFAQPIQKQKTPQKLEEEDEEEGWDTFQKAGDK